MANEPLQDWEIKILRGMIDEHRYKMDREKFTSGAAKRGRVVLVSVAAVVAYVLQMVVIIVALRGK